MNDLAVIKVLGYLYRIADAGERGYAVSASNVNNQGLKILLKSHAQQRSRFKSEILEELHRWGGGGQKFRSSIRGILHRGRINIFSALSTGNAEKEKIVLNEIMVGEKIALKTYEAALQKVLPEGTREIISRQYLEVKKVVEQIQLIRGKEGALLIVQLFNSEIQAKNAIHEIKKAGYQLELVQQLSIHDSIELYPSKSATVFETTISGAVGGALWGSLIGLMAGLSTQQAATLDISPASGAGILIALCAILAGALIGGGLGFAIGIGISGEDSYSYDKSLKLGGTLLLVRVKVLHPSEIGKIIENVQVTSEELVA